MILAVVSTIDLSPILTPALQLGGLILTGIASWALTLVAAHFKVSTNSALFQNLLSAIDRGISYGQQVAQTKADALGKITTQNAVVAEAANYVVSKMPSTMAALGITQAHVADLVLAKLPANPTPAQAQAAAAPAPIVT